MKELKYIKLFEAFESEKLSKTLGYIDSKSRKELLDRVKRICDDIDYFIVLHLGTIEHLHLLYFGNWDGIFVRSSVQLFVEQ